MTDASQLSLTQRCSTCGEVKWLTDFGKNKRRASTTGRHLVCKECRNSLERTGRTRRQATGDPCSVEGCSKPVEKVGLCGMHERRLRIHGDFNQGRIVKTEKYCKDCSLTKPVSEFYRSEKYQVWNTRCKPCCRVYTEQSRQGRRDKDLAQKRAYRMRRHEHWLAYDRARYWADPEKARLAKRAEYRRNPETHKAVNRRWKAENPVHHREMMRLNWQRRRAAKRAAQIAPVTRASWKAKVAYWGNLCWVCRGPWTEMDHVKPITKGGAHMLCNLRPICRSCNAKKSNRWPLPAMT